MIERVVIFRCYCDGCGKQLRTGELLSEDGKGQLIVNLKANSWEKVGQKWYCPQCMRK